MSKTIMIPKIGPNPYVVELNGVRYSYPAGTQQTVPDAVAAIIANDMALRPKEDPMAQYKRDATIWDVMQLLDGADTALRALEERVEALEGASLPVYVPFTVTVGEGGELVTSTTAVFADVKAAVMAKKSVIAEVAIPGGIAAFGALTAKNPAEDPTLLGFGVVVDFSGSEQPPAPQVMSIAFTESAADAKLVNLAVAT